MGNRPEVSQCGTFILVTLLVLSVIMRTTTSFYFGDDPFFQQGFVIPLRKMAVSGGEDIGCHRWTNKKKFEREMELHFTSSKLDSRMCVNYCRIKRYKFAAVSMGRKCSCSNKVSSLKKSPSQYRCNIPCLGDIKYRCGGSGGYFQLFKIITPAGKSDVDDTYIGCFKENDHSEEGSRLLPELFSDTTLMTLGRCTFSCHSRFRKYAALQRGTQCWCGDYPSTVSLLNKASNSSSCNIPCLNTMTTCGGKEHIQMYTLNYSEQRETPLALYVGCFTFVANAKSDLRNVMYDYALTKLENNAADVMSISRCCYLCMVKQKPYAGLLRGNTCYCSIVISSVKEKYRHTDDTCNRPCNENKKFFCGGDAAMQVYKLRPFGYDWETFGFRIEN